MLDAGGWRLEAGGWRLEEGGVNAGDGRMCMSTRLQLPRGVRGVRGCGLSA